MGIETSLSPDIETPVAPLEGGEERVSQQRETPDSNTVNPELEKKLLDPDAWDDKNGNQQTEYTKFITHLGNTPQAKEVIALLEKVTPDDREDYIYENGYPINLDTENAFFQSFPESYQEVIAQKQLLQDSEISDTQTEISDTEALKTEISDTEVLKTEIADTEVLKTEAQTFLSLFADKQASLENIVGLSDTIIFLSQAIESNDIVKLNKGQQKIQAFFQNLESRPEEFQRVAHTFANQGEIAYQEYRAYALQQNPNLQTQFEAFDLPQPILPDIESPVHQAQIYAGLGISENNEATQYGSIVETSSDGQTTRMDISNEPPTRTIGLDGSTLRLETDVPIGDFYPAISQEGLAYEKTASENTSKIQILEALSGEQVQEFIQSEDFLKENLGNALRIISSMVGLPADTSLEDICGQSFSTKEDLQNFISKGGIFTQQKKLQDEIDASEKAFQDALRVHMQAYREHIKEADEIGKKALQICRNAGFDMLDIDYIMQQLSGSIIPQIGVSFNEGNLDIKTLNFGQMLGKEGNEKAFAENIYRLMNKIIFGNPLGVDTDGVQKGFDLGAIAQNPQAQLKTPTQIQDMLKEKEVLNKTTGSMNKTTVMARITQTILLPTGK